MAKPIIDIAGVLEEQDAAAKTKGDASFSCIAGRGHGRGADNIMAIIEQLRAGADWVKYYTFGAFNHHELLIAAVEVTGPAEMYCSTYAMSEAALRTIVKLKEAGLITALHCVVDDRIETRTAGSAQLLRSIADNLVMAHCHAKVTVLTGAHVSLQIAGSANYTENRRIEVGFVTLDKASCDFDVSWIKKIIAGDGR